jgi:NAD(P)-dependent dehydrogenase (short-subunit alcohol dehydrogenase family)
MTTKEKATTRRVALVTGANRGIGLETCRQLLARGFRVAITGRDEGAVANALDTLEHGGHAIAVQMDVTHPGTIGAALETVMSRIGPVDVLVNNAAVLLHEDADVLETPLDGFRQTFETNVFGVIEVCRVFVPPMARRGYGRVVNVSSGVGQLTGMSTYAPAYAMSKTSLNAFTRILSATYQGQGVLANAVDPGWVRTDMGGPSAPRSVEQGADGIVWLATLPDDGPTGGFFRDTRSIPW